MKIGVVILAAGESARMGEPKQLLVHGGMILLKSAIATARAISTEPVIVVLGAHSEKIQLHLENEEVHVAENRDWRDGMGSSLKAGLNSLLAIAPSADAVVFLVCDQPLLSRETLEEIVAAHERTGSPIVAAEYGGTLGVPALFSRALFPELLALSGAEGARRIIQAHRSEVVAVPFPDGAIDLDTPADYSDFLKNPNASAA